MNGDTAEACVLKADPVEERFDVAPTLALSQTRYGRGPSMSKTSLKNIQKQKKKARRTIARPAQSRIQGNTAGVRKRLKKVAGKARAAKASA